MCLSSYIVISCMKVTVHFEFLVTTCVIVQAHASDIKVNIMYNVLSLFFSMRSIVIYVGFLRHLVSACQQWYQ